MEIKITKKRFGIAVMLIITFYVLYVPFSTSYRIVKYSGPVLSDNWWQGLNWIKNNTEECSVIATYWDPGHFITGIAERPVVFDGASQNSLRTITVEGNLTDDEIIDLIGIEKFQSEKFEINGTIYTNITTARIQDIATVLLTDNETQAVKILKRYLMPNCGEMYFIASADLIGKSQWWSYFSTWSPETHSGTKYIYYPLSLSQTKPIISENAIAYIYPMSRDRAFVIYDKNDTLILYFQQGNNLGKVSKFFYFKNHTGYLETTPDAELDGMVWLDPGKQWLIFVPKELENSLFTRMFLFNGQGLEHFELVKNFGGEVKLFKVKFE